MTAANAPAACENPLYDGSDEQLSRLVEQNATLIWSVARRFMGRGVELEDLFQLGSIGFIKAVRGYDPAYGTQLSTYAVPKIAGEIKRFLRDDGMIKVSRSIKENAVRVGAARARLESEKGGEVRLSDLCEATGLSPDEVAMCESAGAGAFSLDAELGEDGFTLKDVLGESTEDALVENIALRQALENLPELERSVLALRFFRDLTQQKAADILGVSQVQVSRVERRALVMLREILTE